MTAPPPLPSLFFLFCIPPNDRRDHEATLATVRAAQAETCGHASDSAVLAAFAHSARVARGEAEAELSRRRKAAEASAATWRRRLEARQREVRYFSF